MVAQLVQQPHPITACAQRAITALEDSTAYEPIFMSTADKRDALLAIAQLERQVAGLKMRVMPTAGDVADEDGARDVAAWIAARTQAEPAPLRAQQKLAAALDERWLQVAAAMTAGRCSLEQAQVIVRGLEDLPDRIGADVLHRAEAHLVDLAADHNPKELRILARRILEVAAPEIAEDEEARRLEEEEKRARDDARLSLKPLGNGSTRITGLLPDETAQRLLAYLHAYTNPRKHPDAISGEDDRIPYRRRLAHAFCALLEHVDPAKLPAHGGDTTTLLVTIPLASLVKDLGTGTILGGQPLSATAIRRLACTADILPAVLGGKGEVLDLGRQRRLFTTAQRRAMALQHPTCFEEHCSVPARECEAHHLKPWSQGGRTDIKDARPACNHHHHLIHDPTYTHEILPNGKIRFHRKR